MNRQEAARTALFILTAMLAAGCKEKLVEKVSKSQPDSQIEIYSSDSSDSDSVFVTGDADDRLFQEQDFAEADPGDAIEGITPDTGTDTESPASDKEKNNTKEPSGKALINPVEPVTDENIARQCSVFALREDNTNTPEPVIIYDADVFEEYLKTNAKSLYDTGLFNMETFADVFKERAVFLAIVPYEQGKKADIINVTYAGNEKFVMEVMQYPDSSEHPGSWLVMAQLKNKDMYGLPDTFEIVYDDYE